ncbi:hypothetical protein DFH09DRAFT_1157822, partial [Mycena vulgaris]
MAHHPSPPSTTDMNSLALVSHALCGSAQAQIFRHVILDPHLLYTVNDSLGRVTGALSRLSAILSTSPHLLRYIRWLSIRAASEILTPLSAIRFPVLAKLRLSFFDMKVHDADTFRLTRDLIGLPSMREVQIYTLGRPHKTLTVDHFTLLFETCTRRLDSLTFDCSFPSNLNDSGVPRPREGVAQIKRLTLYNTNKFEHWAMSPSFPFDFSHLVDDEIESRSGATNSAVLQFLASARLTITRLRFSGAKSTFQFMVLPL